jgi:hypothetical protein
VRRNASGKPHLDRMDLAVGSRTPAGSDKIRWFDVDRAVQAGLARADRTACIHTTPPLAASIGIAFKPLLRARAGSVAADVRRADPADRKQ